MELQIATRISGCRQILFFVKLDIRIKTMDLSDSGEDSDLFRHKYPLIFSYLDPDSERNKKLDLKYMTCGSNKPLDFKCPNHLSCSSHIWTSNANKMTQKMTDRRRKEPCPFCNGSRICKCTSVAWKSVV